MSASMDDVVRRWPISDQEYVGLEKKFDNLAQFASWKLIKKNSRNNHTNSQEDVAQDLRMALLYAASYTKRQIYVEKSLDLCTKYAKTKIMKAIVAELANRWSNKTRHGASKQKFGEFHEKILDRILKALVPQDQWPSKNAPLEIDEKFSTYCKTATWNKQRETGRKITREKSIRGNQVSLSEFEYLSTTGESFYGRE